MAASIIQPDRTLEERLYGLRKRNLDGALRRILEEATQLWGDGRHIEAAALIDKSEAMSSTSPLPGPRVAEAPAVAPAPEIAFGERLAADISAGLSKVFTGAIQELQRHILAETTNLTSTLGERLDKIQTSVDSLSPLDERLDGLAKTTASLQEADARRGAELNNLRVQVLDLSAMASSRIDEVCRRMDEQERQISTANATTSDLASRMSDAATRLERHAAAIRVLHQEHHQRDAALDQVAEVLARVRTVPQSPESLASL